MAPTEFQTPYTKCRSATDGPPPLLYCKGAKETQEICVLSHMTGAIAIVELTYMLTMKVAPIYKRVGTDIRYILLNSSNNDVAPAMAMSGMFDYFSTLETWRDVPDLAIKGIELTTELLEGTGITPTHMHMIMISLPRMIPLGYLKEWIEGSINNQGVLD